MLFYTELPTGAIAYAVLSIPTICMSRADQRGKATRHLADNLPSVVRQLNALAAAPEARSFVWRSDGVYTFQGPLAAVVTCAVQPASFASTGQWCVQ